MLRNYLKITLRNLAKNKVFTSINIVGLAIGMAVCLLILQYVSFKLSFDQFHKNADDVYRVVNDRYQNGKLIQHGTITYSAIGKAMNDDYEEVIRNSKVIPWNEQIIRHGDKKLAEKDVLYVDNSFFSVFSFPFLAGNPNLSLQEPYTIVLSEKLAQKIFDYRGKDFRQFIGKSLIISTDSTPFRIDGIIKDVPENSHLRFNILFSFKTLLSYGWKESDYDFTDSDFWHYVQLKPGTDYEAFNRKLPAFSQKHFQGNKVSGSDEKFYLQPLSKAHLYSDFEYEIGQTGSATVVWGLLIISLFIILIAWVNYINLATARSIDRAKEVGIRKVVGGLKKQLISQFLLESLFINVLGIALAFLIVYLVQPEFNNLLKQKLSLSYLLSKGLNGHSIIISLIAIVISGIFLSGFYPAFVLSSFKPILVLKGNMSTSKGGTLLRKILVVSQFSITVCLIIGSLIVMQQVRYMNKKDLGFNMDHMLIIKPPVLSNFDSTFIEKVSSFKEELKQFSFVKGAATCWTIPGGETGRSFYVRRADSATTNKFTIRHQGVDLDFMPVYGVKLIAGRNFQESDHNPDFDKLHNTLLNVSAVKLLGFASPEEAIGKSIMRYDKKWDVVGVFADYHQKSLRYPMEPTMFFPVYANYSDISLRISSTADVTKTIETIKQKYATFFPGNLFDYFFLDDHFNKQYQNERIFEKVFGIFAGFAIFVACLGLFGLAMHSTVQRTKEIGIRKVLGASVSNILLLLSKDFARLVLLASIIAFPIAWWVMNKWLEDFTYRINMSWWIFLFAGSLALLVALFTVSFQAFWASIANPVKSLRTE